MSAAAAGSGAPSGGAITTTPGPQGSTGRPRDTQPGTLVEMFLQAVDEFDKPDALLKRSRDGSWVPIAHRAILRDVHALSDALVAEGIGRGDRVAILSENRAEWLIADYALLCSGALTVPVYPTLPASQAGHILRHSGARLAFVSNAEQFAKVEEVRSELPALESVVLYDAEGTSGRSFEALLERGRAAGRGENEFRSRALEARPDDVATLIYTSGTTGQPKGVMLTHDNIYSNVRAGVGIHPIGPADVALSFLPLSHAFERTADYGLFAYGCTIAHVAAIDDVPQALRDVQPTLAVGVPRVFEKIYERYLSGGVLRRKIAEWGRQVAVEWSRATLAGRTPTLTAQLQHALADRVVFHALRSRLGGRIRMLVSGGAPLSPEIARFFHGAGIEVLEGYGLTETSPVIAVNTLASRRIGTVGRPIAGTAVQIAEDGEILVRGPQVMKGYYENPAATRDSIDTEGWFHTGDIGELDDDGFLRITDRKKDLIKTAGGKILAPQPLQDAVKRSPYVTDALLIGDRRPYPILLVVPNFGRVEAWARANGVRWADRAELVAHPAVRARIEDDVSKRLEGFARFETPKKLLLLERELTLDRGEITPTLKIRRKVVEDALADRIDAVYAEPSAQPS